MTLGEYLQTHNEKPRAFALRAGLTDAAVSRYKKGLRHPEPPQMQKIIDATGGEVTANDFFVMTRAPRSTRKAARQDTKTKAS